MDLKQMERAIEAYAPYGTEADHARLAFFSGLYALQQQWADRVAAEHAYAVPTSEQVEAWYWNSDPVFALAPVKIDAVLFAETLEAVAGYLVDNAGLEQAAAAGLSAYDWKEFCNKADLDLAGHDPAAFLEACVSNIDAFGVGADIPASLFAMTISLAERVWLQPASEAVMAVAPQDHRMHDCPLDCPVCGTPAAASFVGDTSGSDGKGRMQYCAACGAQWYFERIRCGVCGTHNQRKLHYFNLEGDNAHRIQSCDNCGQYQRVVFQEDIPGALCMEVEDVVMAKLDQVALDPRFRKEEE